jgi:CRP/FNR family transcriptional regulator, cyclic AMP receptor protein
MFHHKRQIGSEDPGTTVTSPISQQERVELLAHVPLFSELTQRELRKPASAAIQREYSPGTSIVRQDETGVGLYIVIRGQALVWQRLPDGTDRRLATLGAQEMFGEMALLDTYPRSASVLAQEATSALVIPIFDFRALLHADSAIAIKLLAVLSRRVRQAESIDR